MHSFLDSLNPEQREAVLHISGPLLIIAGAGSGKTRVIASRIAYLVGDGHAQPDEVLAVTFTNKAAEEMRTRVETLLGSDCSRMWVSTFHSLCARLLRREAPAIGLSRDFVIYDSSDQLTVVKQALKALHVDDSFIQPRAALSRISQAKNRMEGPNEVAAAASWNRRDEQIAKVYEYYLNTLRDSNGLDFDDLLLKTVELFEQSERVRAKYSTQFRFVMVDEYQDTNRPQYLLIRRLVEIHRNLCVVGDPDQSIYKWRGADLRNLLDFEHDFPEAATVKLERNYRSTQIILDAASAVIRQNRNRKDKHLWTDRAGGDRIIYYRGNDELEEADFITRTARAALADSDATAGGPAVAVLYRTNAQSRTIEDALMREGLAYKIVGGVRFYERKEVKDALAYMRLVINPHDDVSLRRVINVPARGIGKGVLEAVEGVSAGGGADMPLLNAGLQPALSANSLWARLVAGLDERRFAARAAASLTVFRDLLVALTEIARHEPVSIAIGKMLDRSGYLQDLRDERSEDAEARVENLAELVSAAREYREPRARTFARRIRRPALAAVGCRRGAGLARCSRLADDLAQRQRPRIPNRCPGRARRRPVPALAVDRRRGGARGGAPALLRGHDSRARAPGADGRRSPASLRRVSVERPFPIHRRGAGRAARPDASLVRVSRPSGKLPSLRIPHEPLRRRAAGQRGAADVCVRGRGSVAWTVASSRYAREACPVRHRHGHQR